MNSCLVFTKGFELDGQFTALPEHNALPSHKYMGYTLLRIQGTLSDWLIALSPVIAKNKSCKGFLHAAHFSSVCLVLEPLLRKGVFSILVTCLVWFPAGVCVGWFIGWNWMVILQRERKRKNPWNHMYAQGMLSKPAFRMILWAWSKLCQQHGFIRVYATNCILHFHFNSFFMFLIFNLPAAVWLNKMVSESLAFVLCHHSRQFTCHAAACAASLNWMKPLLW